MDANPMETPPTEAPPGAGIAPSAPDVVPGGINNIHWTPPDVSFRPLTLKVKENAEFKPQTYHVWGMDGVPMAVEAATAKEALEKSGVTQPVRVARVGLRLDGLISADRLREFQQQAEAPASPTPETTEKE